MGAHLEGNASLADENTFEVGTKGSKWDEVGIGRLNAKTP